MSPPCFENDFLYIRISPPIFYLDLDIIVFSASFCIFHAPPSFLTKFFIYCMPAPLLNITCHTFAWLRLLGCFWALSLHQSLSFHHTAGKYESHTRVHTREKPFQCDVCLQRYSTKSNLTVHKKKHTADAPVQRKEHKCPFCSKLHASRKTLSKHVKRWVSPPYRLRHRHKA